MLGDRGVIFEDLAGWIPIQATLSHEIELMKHRFLQSAGHSLGQERDGTLVKHDHVRSALLADVKELAKNRETRRAFSLRVIFHILENRVSIRRQRRPEKLTEACGCDGDACEHDSRKS